MAEEDKGTKGPQFDSDALAGIIRQEMSGFIQEQRAADASRAEQERSERDEQAVRARTASDPVAAAVLPHLIDPLRRVALVAEAAQDAALFYGEHPEVARDAKRKGRIEEAFNRGVQSGNPLKREDIYFWDRGKNAAEYAADEAAKAQAAQKAAEEAGATMGGLRLQPGQVPQAILDPSSVSFEDMDKALTNVSF